MFNKSYENISKGISRRLSLVIFFFKAHCIPPGFLLLADFIHKTFYFYEIRLFLEVLRCHNMGMFLKPSRERGYLGRMGCSIHKKISVYFPDIKRAPLTRSKMHKRVIKLTRQYSTSGLKAKKCN